MKKITQRMYESYKMKEVDWLGYEIHSLSSLDAHHIIKKADGGLYREDNIAILNNHDHRYLHIIESKDLELYAYLNIILKKINEQGKMSSINQLLAINSILEQFEREYSGTYNSKGEPLIKEEYTKRLIKKI